MWSPWIPGKPQKVNPLIHVPVDLLKGETNLLAFLLGGTPFGYLPPKERQMDPLASFGMPSKHPQNFPAASDLPTFPTTLRPQESEATALVFSSPVCLACASPRRRAAPRDSSAKERYCAAKARYQNRPAYWYGFFDVAGCCPSTD